MHSLMECAMARLVWALMDEELVEHMALNQIRDPQQWIFFMQDSLNHSDSIRVLVTLWEIWKARRKAIHENQFESPISTVGHVNRFIMDLGSAIPAHEKSNHQPHRTRTLARWIGPAEDQVKLDCDGAVARDGRWG
jgi:hypothetical protein